MNHYADIDQKTTGKVYSDYLSSLDWDNFVTVTFRTRRRDSINSGNQIWQALDRIEGIQRSFLISEPHTSGYLHYHGLLRQYRSNNYPPLNTAGYIGGILTRVFGWSRVEDIKSMQSVTSYCAKYIVKAIDDPAVDYNTYGDWRDVIIASALKRG